MAKEYFKGPTEEARGYSQAVKVKGGTHVFLCGVGGVEDASGKSLAGDFDAQVYATFDKIKENLAQTGGTLDDLVNMTVFIRDMQHGSRFVQLRREILKRDFPGSAMIGISSLARHEMMVEIQAVAVVDD